MSDPATAWLNALAFLAGYGAAKLQHLGRVRAGRRSNGNCVPLPPAPPGLRGPDLRGPIKEPPGNTLAECGGPCWEQCWEACDCGLLDLLNPHMLPDTMTDPRDLIRAQSKTVADHIAADPEA